MFSQRQAPIAPAAQFSCVLVECVNTHAIIWWIHDCRQNLVDHMEPGLQAAVSDLGKNPSMQAAEALQHRM